MTDTPPLSILPSFIAEKWVHRLPSLELFDAPDHLPHYQARQYLDLVFPETSISQRLKYRNMSENVGLTTPRGSGTSGYVQRNLAHLKPRDHGAPYPKDLDSLRHKQRQPDKGILEHDRKRQIEVKVFDLRDKLEEEEYVVNSLVNPITHTTR